MDSDKHLSLCLVDYHQGKLKLSGQHEEIVVVRAGGIVERIDTIDLGFPIGLEENIEGFIFQVEIKLESQDVVVLYTDGITEAENSYGQQYGLERLCQTLINNWTESAEQIRQLVIADVREHIGLHKVYDDITLVILKQK
jgi:sigma-B regulation protein RsbU (phosphoserine phosphatase)